MFSLPPHLVPTCAAAIAVRVFDARRQRTSRTLLDHTVEVVVDGETSGPKELHEHRWRRYGKDRVYLRTADGIDAGYIDLLSGETIVALPDLAEAVEAARRRWLATEQTSHTAVDTDADPRAARVVSNSARQPNSAVSTSGPHIDQAVAAPVRDLASNPAGAAAQARRNELNAEAPVRNLIARVLGVHTPERAWRVGAEGERKVAAQLAKLGDAWRVLHAVEVGSNGGDIDHVVIGPPGVFTLNAKRHPGGRAWVGEHTIMVNGTRTPYLRNARFEATRATRLLSTASGRPVQARAVIVFVDLDNLKVEQMPADVRVVARRQLKRWLESLPGVLSPDDIGVVYGVARRADTWSTR